MTMTEIRGRLGIELADKRLANAVLSELAYRVPHKVLVEGDIIECPICGHEYESVEKITAYCPDCGQKLYEDVLRRMEEL